MNPEWSRLNGAHQTQLKQEATFPQGIDTLLTLRREPMAALLDLKETLRREDFDAMPFPKANGYHRKTIAYSLWHIFRIEDIVAHDLICRDDEVFRDFRDGIGAPITTTGNELAGGEIAAFSRHWIMHVEASLRIRNKLWEHKMGKTTCKIQKKSTTKPG